MWEGRPPRVEGFEYRGYQRYFITLTTRFRARSFSDPPAARALASQIAPFFTARSFAVVAYCVMPDHMHLLLEGVSDNADLREAAKTGHRLWQPGFYDRVLREDDDTRLVVRYILWNPVRAKLVESVRAYQWSGSSRYTVGELEESSGNWAPAWKRR